VTVPQIKDHAGLDDLLAKEGGEATFKVLCDAAQLWTAAKSDGGEPIVTSLHGIESEEVDYIIEGRIARANLTMYSGDPGSSKTFLALCEAASLTRGRVPATEAKCAPLRILYASTENSAAHVIGPRFRAMGGDDKKFFLLDGATDAKGNSMGITFGNLAPVERAIQKHKIDVVYFDPLQSYFGADADFHKANEVRPRMDALMKLATKYNVAVVLIRHLAKSSGGRAIHKGLGSIDFTGAVRIEMMIGNRADAPNDRAILTVKNNLGRHAPGLRFAIEGDGMDARLVWKGETSLSLGDLIAPESAKGNTGISRAIEFLNEQLKDGPRQFSELLATSEFGERMLERAAKLSGIVRTREKARGPVTWSLPRHSEKEAKGE
jgi:hypothetical protein